MGRKRRKISGPDEPLLFELPPKIPPEPRLKALKHPIWTENKAQLIERYLFYFVLVTKHGTYIDGFAGPQKPGKPDTWAAKLVLDSEPKWLRHFYLFDRDKRQFDHLLKLRDSQPPPRRGEPKREVQVCQGDFNLLVHDFLESRVIKETEATFCLLDQRTFECQWETVRALAEYKQMGHKIELFYFLPNHWLPRALAAIRNKDVVAKWWGRDDWQKLSEESSQNRRVESFVGRFTEELGYKSVMPWPIYQRRNGGSVMYYMIHATDHSKAPGLMRRAYEKAVHPRESYKQLLLEFGDPLEI